MRVNNPFRTPSTNQWFNDAEDFSFTTNPVNSVVSNVIVTSEIDAYRQGVEITQFKHFDAGMVKIHAGEQGHILRRNRGGMDRNHHTMNAFVETSRIDPATHLLVGGTIIDADMLDGKILDGVLEPLTIRAVAGFFSVDGKYDAHGIYGSMMAGGEDSDKSSAQIVTVFEYDAEPTPPRFLDMVSAMTAISGTAMRHAYDVNPIHIKPFIDRRDTLEDTNMNVHQTAMSYAGTPVAAAIRLMSGSRDNGYVSTRQISATCGWVYDNVTGIGTDSIAFGGMTY